MLLFISACVRPESRTLPLARHLVSRLSDQVEFIDLYQEDLPELDLASLCRRDACGKSGDYDDPIFRYARQFADADTIVIAAPYWDLGFPARVKRYFELVTATGVTFYYTPEGFPKGLCRAKRLYYVTTAGGPIFMNFGFDYAKAMAQSFYGIPEVHCIQAENLDIIGADVDAILNKTRQEIDLLPTT